MRQPTNNRRLGVKKSQIMRKTSSREALMLPATLEHSGTERRVGAVTSLVP